MFKARYEMPFVLFRGFHAMRLFLTHQENGGKFLTILNREKYKHRINYYSSVRLDLKLPEDVVLLSFYPALKRNFVARRQP